MIVFLSVGPTNFLLRKVCEEGGGKERAPVTFWHLRVETEPYFIMSLGSQSSAAFQAEFTSRKGWQQSSLTCYCPAICGVLSPASFWFLHYKGSWKCIYIAWEMLKKKKKEIAVLLACDFSPCRHWLERKLVTSPSAAVVVRSFTLELR